ncbi:MAG: hypothetical protein JSR17_12420 [Proteobacteria bacterium]|nr:hypothetical protein [Pseudomonadota bacterium]
MQSGPKKEQDTHSKPTTWSVLWHSIMGGGAAGAAEVVVDHPLWSLKTRYQNDSIPAKEKFTLNLKILYRGFLPNVFSMVPITALQVSTAQGIKAHRHNDEENPPSELQSLSYSAAGGAVSAVVSAPTELAMAQQTEKRGFFATVKHIYQNQGFKGLLRGFTGTAIRDAKFTVGYGYAAPALKEKLAEHMSEPQAGAIAGVGAGVTVAALSQPWDTLKTAQQTGSELPLWKLAAEKLKQQGIAGLYKGSFWRMSRVASAVTIMGEVNQRISSWLKD